MPGELVVARRFYAERVATTMIGWPHAELTRIGDEA
jgi:hypothetical protein